MRLLRPAFTGALLLTLLGACAAPQSSRLVAKPGALPPRAEVAEVPFFPQERFYCGPAALAMSLAWSGLPVTQEEIAAQVYTPGREGTLRSDLLSAVRRHGRLGVPVPSLADLLAEIAAGNPVLVFQNLALDWHPQWHFAVAIGYDLEARHIVLHSGRDERRITPLDTFEHTWRRGDYWALVVLPPERLPAVAAERSVMQAAAGIERAGRLPEAAVAYQAMLGRWPGSFAPLMGLGNVRFAERDLAAAERAYRQAIAADGDSPAPWNNLAYVLIDQGRDREALDAAAKAVALSGEAEDAAVYRDTLQDITRRAGKAAGA